MLNHKLKIAALLSLVLGITITSCSKKNSAPASSALKQDTITVESIIGTDDLDPTRFGWIDLYDGKTFNQPQAAANSSQIDFAYNYHGGGCSSCRVFENVESMSTRTGYVYAFSTLTNSLLAAADSVTISEFDALKTPADIDVLLAKTPLIRNYAIDITNGNNDVAIHKIFAFTDKSGKKGLFRISDYIANVPQGDRAVLTLYVKMEK
ncbi:hypothetical protein Q4E93_18770 [Flavitalea sp. BT771]|uniref:hypothetical protein n=1 Tax=Flavitalea sp. BT771 TaxID=3063329 RepID=UPI0026E47611|nr:hypothetical protein [Flavitalea sp. BT771]MDO6432656.1 hypothetical protein [Flavitalea sp. BT771]MDV6222068.1 hypothetical protein [Flavitalea sp. BT771]